MTRFDKDLQATINGDGREVIRRRQAQLAEYKQELRQTKNGFRAMSLRQDIARLEKELKTISEHFN